MELFLRIIEMTATGAYQIFMGLWDAIKGSQLGILITVFLVITLGVKSLFKRH